MGFFKRLWIDAEFRNSYCEVAGLYLLYAFILSISFNPFYVFLLSDTRQLSYVIENQGFVDQSTGILYQNTYTPEQVELLNSYKEVDAAYVERMRLFNERTSWIIVIALLGWVSTSPRFQRGWPKLINSLKSDKLI